MKILIIGGNRFVGKLVTKKLHELGHDLTLMNRTGTSPVQCKVLKCDRNNPIEFEQAIGDNYYDAIIDMCLYNLTQAKITTSILGHRSQKYIFISSIASYEATGYWPIDETAPLGGMKCFGDYGSEKAEVEQYLQSIDNFPYIILRPTYIIGKDNHVYREKYYFDQILNSEAVNVGSEKNCVASFVFVEDVAEIICLLTTWNSLLRQTYNLAGDEHVTIEKLIDIISDITDMPYTLQDINGAGKFADTHAIIDNQKIKQRLNFKFRTLEKGLKEFYEYTY